MMADRTKSKKPVPDARAEPPETHAQTQPVEQKISPQHNTTEPYGTSDDQARTATSK
jgi:hypothetical protein